MSAKRHYLLVRSPHRGPAQEDYGFDVAISYRGKSLGQLTDDAQAKALVGVNIIFENVGENTSKLVLQVA
jgi:NADPH-dependent curcumin reductase CurA